ncbi:MAG: hypothetical protein ABL957_15390 [Parvularculaceae bacterium]
MNANSGADKDPASGPPEIEAELVREPRMTPGGPASLGGEPTPAGRTAGRPGPNRLILLTATAAIGLAIVGGGYWAIRQLLSRGAAPGIDSAESQNAEHAASPPIAYGAPAEASNELTPLVAAAPDDGDALSAVAEPGVTARPQAHTEPLAGGVGAPGPVGDPSLSSDPASSAKAADPLAALEAEAEAFAADQSNGVAPLAADPPASTAGPPTEAERSMAGELETLRARFETEMSRLTAELGAERARAEAQGQEITALRDVLASLNAQAQLPQTVEPPQAGAAQQRPVDISSTKATLVLFALTRAVESGAPYKIELSRAEALAPSAPAIDRLRIDASEGAPTLAELKARFPDEARKALAADAGKSGGALGRFAAGVADLVSIMPAGPVTGARPAAVLSRVEAALSSDNVEAAAQELKALQGPALTSMNAFISDAERLTAARASLSELTAYLIESASG